MKNKKGKFDQGIDWAERAFGKGPQGMDAESFGRWYREEIFRAWNAIDLKAVARVAGWLKAARGKRKQIFVIGNGGSASTASHLACDLTKTAARRDSGPLRVLSLTDNVGTMTAIANDLGYDKVFTRQMENLLNPGDIVLLISGSGNSPSMIDAARYARRKRARTVGLLGFDGGKLKREVDVVLHVDSSQYGVVEDLHMGIGNIFTFYLKQAK